MEVINKFGWHTSACTSLPTWLVPAMHLFFFLFLIPGPLYLTIWDPYSCGFRCQFRVLEGKEFKIMSPGLLLASRMTPLAATSTVFCVLPSAKGRRIEGQGALSLTNS